MEFILSCIMSCAHTKPDKTPRPLPNLHQMNFPVLKQKQFSSNPPNYGVESPSFTQGSSPLNNSMVCTDIKIYSKTMLLSFVRHEL